VTDGAAAIDSVDYRFDDYRVEPVMGTDVREPVERLLLIDAYSERRPKPNQLRAERNVLEVETAAAVLVRDGEYPKSSPALPRSSRVSTR
jgi:hypothetical protein